MRKSVIFCSMLGPSRSAAKNDEELYPLSGTIGHICTNAAACENGQCVLPMVKIQPTQLGDVGKVRF